jgi:hypothetical protein
MNQFLKILAIAVSLLVSTHATFAEDLNPSAPLTEAQKLQTTEFTAGYLKTLEVVETIMGLRNDSRDPETARLLELLKGCAYFVFADGDLLTVEGENCKIQFERTLSKASAGNDEMGNEIVVESTSEFLVINDDSIADLVGLRSWRFTKTVRGESLASTPVDLKVTQSHLHALTNSGQLVEMSSQQRLYTNLENFEETYFRRQILDFEKFDVRYEVTTRRDDESNVLSEKYILNQQPSTLAELTQLVSADLIF